MRGGVLRNRLGGRLPARVPLSPALLVRSLSVLQKVRCALRLPLGGCDLDVPLGQVGSEGPRQDDAEWGSGTFYLLSNRLPRLLCTRGRVAMETLAGAGGGRWHLVEARVLPGTPSSIGQAPEELSGPKCC